MHSWGGREGGRGGSRPNRHGRIPPDAGGTPRLHRNGSEEAVDPHFQLVSGHATARTCKEAAGFRGALRPTPVQAADLLPRTRPHPDFPRPNGRAFLFLRVTRRSPGPRLLAGALAALAVAVAGVRAAGEPEPLWAYGFLTPPAPGETAPLPRPPARPQRPAPAGDEQTRPRHVPGSQATFSLAQIRDARNAVDWFPGDHPPMPPVVVHGPVALGDATRACASCHLPSGRGRPENAPLAGQPVAYLLRQLQDFRSGARHTIDPRKGNTPIMIALAACLTDEEAKAAAAYFSAIAWTLWTRVVETDLVPPTRLSGNLFLPVASARTEPIAGRIIEVPEDVDQAETLRNPRSGFVAYVPVGSVRRGEFLVKTGGMTVVDGAIVPGPTTACATCHGPDLMGLADVPGIAGRSPSYLVRQLYDLQQGSRHGASAPLMQPVVAKLTGDEMTAIAAYVASLAPPVASASR